MIVGEIRIGDVRRLAKQRRLSSRIRVDEYFRLRVRPVAVEPEAGQSSGERHKPLGIRDLGAAEPAVAAVVRREADVAVEGPRPGVCDAPRENDVAEVLVEYAPEMTPTVLR